MKNTWKQRRYKLEVWGCEFLAKTIPRLPRRSCVALGQLTGALGYWFDRRGRSVALENLRIVFGYDLPDRQLQLIAMRSYQNFARTMLDLFWSPRVNKTNYHMYLEVNGFKEALERSRLERRGVTFVCFHHGAWEWAPLAAESAGMQVHIVAETFKNKELTDVFVRLRSRGFHNVIPQENAFLKLLKRSLKGEHTALLGDLTVQPSQAAVILRTFQRDGEPLEICATRMHAILAKRGRSLVVPVFSHPLPDGRCRVTALEPMEISEDELEETVTQRTWDILEKQILKCPELWLWAYKHLRYRPRAASRNYPEYAREFGPFEAIRESSLKNSPPTNLSNP